MDYSDAHLHLANMDKESISEISNGFRLLYTCSSNEDEWALTENISSDKDHVRPFFGTHPWFVKSYRGTEKLIEYLTKNTDAGVGEIGLDRNKGSIEEQIPVFLEQLSVAEKMNRPVTIHMVRTEEETLHALRRFRVTSILHSFSGPASYIRPFTECKCFFSISPRILNKTEDRIRSIVAAIPNDRILIESDAPNNRASIYELIGVIAPMLSMSEEEFASLALRNLLSIP